MSHDSARPAFRNRRRLNGPETDIQSVWEIDASDADYPVQLQQHPFASHSTMIYGIGNRELLRRPCLGLICSIQCPGSVIIRTFDAIRELRDADVIVAGGFHSPMEKECLDFLLRGRQPVIICPAKHPRLNGVPKAWRSPLDSGRLLLLSPFASRFRRTTGERAQMRNEFVAAVSRAVFVPHASPEGKTMGLVQRLVQINVPLVTLQDATNHHLLQLGACTYETTRVREFLIAEAG